MRDREERLKPHYLMDELKAIRNELRKVSMLVENRVIGTEEPTKEDIKAIRVFENTKRNLRLIPLSKLK